MIIGNYLTDQIFMNSCALTPKCSKINTLSGFGWVLVDANDQSRYIQRSKRLNNSMKSIKNQ